MATRYTVAPGREFYYPLDPESEKIIKKAGGFSKLSKDDKTKVKYKTVTEGQDCSDMPKSALSLYLERSWVIATSAKESTKDKKIEDIAAEVEKEEINNG